MVFLLLWLFTPVFVWLPFEVLWLVPLVGLILLHTTKLAYCWAFTLGGGAALVESLCL